MLSLTRRRAQRAGRAITVVATALLLTAPSLRAQAAPATQAKLDDPTIVAIFDAANTWDIQTGNLAAKRGTTSDVRQFGRMLVHDHTAVRQQGRDLAKKLGVHPTAPANPPLYREHVAAMAKLRGLHGKAFDRAFLQNEVTYHQAVIDAVTKTLLPAIQNAELKDFVTKVAPAFQAHMMRAQQMLDAMGK
jgi:putative membrane protein